MPLIRVVFPDSQKRPLLIDETEQGYTNEELELEAGVHHISIKNPPCDFHPLEQKICLKDPDNNGDPDKVTKVIFEKI
jgi:hypothetical protein